MKEIQPIQIWNNGKLKTAEKLSAIIINDNLESSCTFYWQLMEADIISEENTTTGQQLAQGNQTMTGDDYLNWDGSNDAAYEWVAGKINVVIV
jgi:hypothetical protein